MNTDRTHGTEKPVGIPISGLVQSIRGGPNQGTWVHPRIALHLAMWCDPHFGVKVLGWVEEWLRTKENPLAKHGQQSIPVIALLEEEIRTALSKVGSRIAAALGVEFWEWWDDLHRMHHGKWASEIKRYCRSLPKDHPLRRGIRGWNQMSARQYLWYIDRAANMTESLEIDMLRCGADPKGARCLALTEGKALVNGMLGLGLTMGSLALATEEGDA